MNGDNVKNYLEKIRYGFRLENPFLTLFQDLKQKPINQCIRLSAINNGFHLSLNLTNNFNDKMKKSNDAGSHDWIDGFTESQIDYLKNNLNDFKKSCQYFNLHKKILLVDFIENIASFSITFYNILEYYTHSAITIDEIKRKVRQVHYQFIVINTDFILIDLNLALDQIRSVKSKNKNTPIFLMTDNLTFFDQIHNVAFDQNIYLLKNHLIKKQGFIDLNSVIQDRNAML